MSESNSAKRVLIVGGRDFNDYDYLKSCCDTILPDERYEVISGGAKGADSLAHRYAEENIFQFVLFPARWEEEGKKAGFLRNKRMIDYLRENDEVIAFWDGKSKGTKHTIDMAKAKGLNLFVFKY